MLYLECNDNLTIIERYRRLIGSNVDLFHPWLLLLELRHQKADGAEILGSGEGEIGSFGPTTAQRMDGYLPDFMARGASLITLAKGNRSAIVNESCRRHGGFYLGTIGGAAALLAKENIVDNELLDYADLGMEAVRKIKVKNLPAFIVVDDKGNNLYGC